MTSTFLVRFCTEVPIYISPSINLIYLSNLEEEREGQEFNHVPPPRRTQFTPRFALLRHTNHKPRINSFNSSRDCRSPRLIAVALLFFFRLLFSSPLVSFLQSANLSIDTLDVN